VGETSIGLISRGGYVEGAANALLQIQLAVGLPALPALLNPLQSVANVIKAFTADPLATELLLSGFIAPLISTPQPPRRRSRTSLVPSAPATRQRLWAHSSARPRR
jgi:hypothetical protein